MDLSRHAGRVALVTGAGSGIGRATTLRLAREGALVVGCDVDADGLATTTADLADAGLEATLLEGDITSQPDVDRVVDETIGRHGRVDVLANVAGINDWFLPAHEVDDDTWARVIAVNITGPLMLCRKVLPFMRDQQSGAIVNVGSVSSLGGGGSGVAYTTSKHAVIGLTRSIAWTYQEEGIRCCAVCPGAVATGIGSTSVPRSEWGLDRLRPVLALRRTIADPDEIAGVISWLASDEATNVNGAIVSSDGGWGAA